MPNQANSDPGKRILNVTPLSKSEMIEIDLSQIGRNSLFKMI